MASYDSSYDPIKGVVNWVGNVLGTDNTDQVNAAIETLENSKRNWSDNYNKNNNLLDNYLNSVNDMYGDSLSKRNDTLSKMQGLSYDPSTFTYNKSVEDFLSPAIDMRVKTASNAITNSQANAGNMFSSDYLNSLNAKAQAIASEEYDNAFNRYNQDKSQSLQEQQFNANEKKNAYDAQSNLYANLLNNYNNDLTNYNNGISDYYSGRINNNNAYTEGLTNIDQSIADVSTQKQQGIGSVLGAVGNVIGAIF